MSRTMQVDNNRFNINKMRTYEYIDEILQEFGCALPVSGTNEDGEAVIIEQGWTEDNEHFYRLTTVQKNNWLRINEYYADGTVTETFKR